MRGVLSRGGLGRLGSLCVYAVRSRRDGPGSREKGGRLGPGLPVCLCCSILEGWAGIEGAGG